MCDSISYSIFGALGPQEDGLAIVESKIVICVFRFLITITRLALSFFDVIVECNETPKGLCVYFSGFTRASWRPRC